MAHPSKAAFLDRDGVINVDRGYVWQVKEFAFVPGAIDAMRRLQGLGYLLVVITNQSGIGRGYYTEEDFALLTKHMRDELANAGVNLNGVYYCPHLPEATVAAYRCFCDCRKPEPGMFRQAAKELAIDLSRSIVVGDKASDIAAGRAAGVRSCYLIANSANPPIEQIPDGVFASLQDLSVQLVARI